MSRDTCTWMLALGRPCVVGGAVDEVIERRGIAEDCRSKLGTSPPVLWRSFCSSVYRTPPVSDTRLDSAIGRLAEERPGLDTNLREGPDLNPKADTP